MTVIGKRRKNSKGQSFVELAMIVPLLLLVLAGMVEVAFFMFSYLTAVDLTREAARFASTRDYRKIEVEKADGQPQDVKPGDPLPIGKTIRDTCSDKYLHYYYDAACFFVDPDLNPYIPITSTNYSDVTISVMTVTSNTVTNRYPEVGVGGIADNVFSLYNDNWKKDCDGNVVLSDSEFSNARVRDILQLNALAPKNKGIVLIEVYYCYRQTLNLPIISQFVPETIRVHTYTLMPAPEAIPTPTPIP